jgi:hypothetical protein
MVAIIIACILVVFFMLMLPHLMFGVLRIFENLFRFTFYAVLSVMKFTIKLLSVFALFGVAKFIFKKEKTVK